MSNQPNYPPEAPQPPESPAEDSLNAAPDATVAEASPVSAGQTAPGNDGTQNGDSQRRSESETPEEMHARLERLGGEPAPDITPEEFARLQQSGQIHIDPRGRVRSTQSRQLPYDAGVSLRKRRAWYHRDLPGRPAT